MAELQQTASQQRPTLSRTTPQRGPQLPVLMRLASALRLMHFMSLSLSLNLSLALHLMQQKTLSLI